MKKLNLYITKQILVGFLLVTFTLMSIIWLTQSLRFVDLITNKGLPISTFVLMTSLLMPRIFSILCPICLFVAVLFVYTRMLNDRELIVMKAAGISPWQNSKPALLVGILLSIFNAYVLNYGIASSEKHFDEIQWQVKNNVSHLMFREGEFTSIQDNLTVFITSHEDDNSIYGVLINDERKIGKKSTLSAEMGKVVYTAKGPKIILINGNKQELDTQTSQFSSILFDRYSVDFGMGEKKKRKEAGVRQQSFKYLMSAIDNPDLPKKLQNKYFIEGNKRIITPLLNIAMAMIACCGLLVGNFNRRGQTNIVLIGIIGMVSIEALDLIFTNLAVKHLALLPVLYLNILAPLAICLYFFFFYCPAKFARRKGLTHE